MTILLGLGCPAPTPPEYTVEESEAIARAFVEESPTYQFDGIEGSLELVHTETLRCPGCWQFTYQFQSAHAGYGDRTGQVLAQVITPHEAMITVEKYEVTGAVMDGRWDIRAQSFIRQ